MLICGYDIANVSAEVHWRFAEVDAVHYIYDGREHKKQKGHQDVFFKNEGNVSASVAVLERVVDAGVKFKIIGNNVHVGGGVVSFF